MPACRDAQRARVYRSEDAWADRLDAARRGARSATIAGSSVLLPAERRFGAIETIAAYARAVLVHPDVVAAVGAVEPPQLRTRNGGRAAHWEAPGTIAVHVPRHGEGWALREAVLLHELAHHLGRCTGLAPHHGAPFPALMVLLVRAALGVEAALALRVDYGSEHVQVGELGG